VESQIGGFARDLFIDHVRWSYFNGAIAYVNPRTLGLEQFPEKDAFFADLFKEYGQRILKTYRAIHSLLLEIQGSQK